MSENPTWDPHTVVDFADIAPNYKPGRIHVAGGVWVNGSPVRMSTKGPRLIYRRGEPTLVRLDLMPDQINFGAEPVPSKPFDPLAARPGDKVPGFAVTDIQVERHMGEPVPFHSYELLPGASMRPRTITVTFTEVL